MKKTIAFVLISSLVFVGCSSPPTSGSPATESRPTTAIAAKKSLKDLIGLGIAQKCTYSNTVGTDTASGEMLINGKKFKQTTKITNSSGVTTMSSISDGQFIYSWNDKTPNSGFKMKLDVTATSDVTPQAGSSAGKSVDLTQQYDYNCASATVSDADFTPPSTVKFTDFSDFTKDLNLDQLKKLIPTGSSE